MRRILAIVMAATCLGAAQDVPADEARPAQSLGEHAADFWDELKVVVNNGETKRLRIEYENDLFYSTDRNYTNGVRFTWRAKDEAAR